MHYSVTCKSQLIDRYFDQAAATPNQARQTPAMSNNIQFRIIDRLAHTAATTPSPSSYLGTSGVQSRLASNRSTSTKHANPSRKTVLLPLPDSHEPRVAARSSQEQLHQQGLASDDDFLTGDNAEIDLDAAADSQSLNSNIAELADTRNGAAQTLAEFMSKEERWGMPRVTAYVTAANYDILGLITFLVTKHRVQVRSYDECLYAPYPSCINKPLMATPVQPVRSKSRNSKQAQLLWNQLLHPMQPSSPLLRSISEPALLDRYNENDQDVLVMETTLNDHSPPRKPLRTSSPSSAHTPFLPLPPPECEDEPLDYAHDYQYMNKDLGDIPLAHGELFFFEYGVTVFWNFTETQERILLKSIRPFEIGRLPDDDVQVEDFHFQYERVPGSKARIFNDMITLRTGDLQTQLTVSHAIAQSCKLAFFEVRMTDTIESTQHIPKSLATTGHVQLGRREVTRMRGHIFQLKVDVNLVSNVLDTPDFFWTEPGLTPLYLAVQTYLEIPQRVATVNIRTSVLSDMLEMLSSHTTTTKMDYLTWIVIALISIDVVVMLGEIFVKGLKVGA